MSAIDELVQDLRAHAHEAPAVCAALMRRAATELHARRFVVLAVAPGADGHDRLASKDAPAKLSLKSAGGKRCS